VSRKALLYGEAALFTLALTVPVHYLGGLDWPWALVIGLAASLVLRVLIHGRSAARL